MAIYEIEKLKDELHVQDESPNPQIYALFKMGQELEQKAVGGGASLKRTTIPFNSYADYKANVMDKLKFGDEVIFTMTITVEGNKNISMSSEPFMYIANSNLKGHATCALNEYFTSIITTIRINDYKTFSGILFSQFTTGSADQIIGVNFSINTNDDFNTFSGIAFIYEES